MLVVESAITTIRSFDKLYKAMLLRWERQLLKTGYSSSELSVLSELRVLTVCTKRELASRICLPVEKMDYVLHGLQLSGKIKIEPDTYNRRLDYVQITDSGKQAMVLFDGLYEEIILSDMQHTSVKEQIELMMHLEKAKSIFERISKREVGCLDSGNNTDEDFLNQ